MTQNQILAGYIMGRYSARKNEQLIEKLLSSGLESRILRDEGDNECLIISRPGDERVHRIRIPRGGHTTYYLEYADAADILRVLRPVKKTLEDARCRAWRALYTEEGNRLIKQRNQSHLPGAIYGQSAEDLGILQEVKTTETDEALLAIVRRYLNADTLTRVIWSPRLT